jgi:anti-sigma regulatory factor (Ser/Thr protein kinase)/putative methionine-R-sulfoxide reductase with GAF domain
VPVGNRSDTPTGLPPRTGQVVLEPAEGELVPSEQVATLYRLNDPALSELGLEEFLNELLIRVQDALSVDTVAILLYDAESQQLVARAAKGIEEEVEQGVRIPIGRGFAGRIAAERVAIFIGDVDHADIMNPILREKGIRSLLGTPLIVEGDLIGVLHVGSLAPRRFGPRDLAVLQVAAARAAPGIERARLYSALEHEHHVAMVLQRSLLPTHLAGVAGVSAAARYMPASYDVGGDWYDVFQLPQGRFGIVIGDVVGHGLKAAALMGQLRTALHAYAVEAHSPARTLQQVDRFMRTMSEPAMATAAYAVLDAETGALELASAGHLPPLVMGPRGARIVELPPAPPLGAFPYATWPEQEMSLAPGETLLFYTDGLVERPGTPLNESIQTLLSVVAGASSAEEACRMAVEQMIPFGRLRDDVAMVAMHYGRVPARLSVRLPTEPSVLADARQLLRRWLHSHEVPAQDAREILLAVNEACANAIEHAYSPAPAEFQLEATHSDGELVFRVTDTGTWRSPRGQLRGRGLKLIEAAMDEVQVDRSDAGTVVEMHRRIRP